MIRRFQLIVIAAILLIAAFSTQLEFLFYLVYLSILVIGGSYILTRLGLADLEAGYAVNQLTGHVGDKLQITYTLRNTSRVPKPWLEVHNPTTLPGGLPGRAISLGSRAERSWLVRAPLTRRGHFRVEPLQIRTGDPFGFFEASASVGQGVAVVVYPRIERLPLWRLPAANIEGSHAAPERTLQTSPLATAVRPYAPGDAFNRIHWKSTAATARSRSRSSSSSRPPTHGSSSTSSARSRAAVARNRRSSWPSGPRRRSRPRRSSRTARSGSRSTATARRSCRSTAAAAST